jgi:hypothetical protein
MRVAVEDGRILSKEPEKQTSGAKALLHFAACCVGVKTPTYQSCPGTKQYFSQPVKRRSFKAANFSAAPLGLLLTALAVTPMLFAQAPASEAGPIAIVPLDSNHPDRAATVTGALEVSQGRAVIAASGTVTSGSETTQVTLPHRGILRVCATTTVKLASDSSVPLGETPGLMMAMDHGAVEMSYATGRNSDILLTPDFRILIGGSGAAEVKVRLGQHGDTCVDNAGVPSDRPSSQGLNAGVNAPYVLVSSVFEGGAYRVQPGQRVMFQHGSLHEMVDQEKEPCGCPPPTPKDNEFPLAQSEGLAPLPKPAPNAVSLSSAPPQVVEPLVYKGGDHAAQPATEATPAASTVATKPVAKKKSGFFGGIRKFFHRLFGAE